MTLEEFRIEHSILIEHYQFIEAYLEGIYAKKYGGDFYQNTKTVEGHNIRRLLGELKKIDKEQRCHTFKKEEYDLINSMCDERNFWCHNCYFELVFDIKTKGPKKQRDIERLKSDIWEARELREMLYLKYMEIT